VRRFPPGQAAGGPQLFGQGLAHLIHKQPESAIASIGMLRVAQQPYTSRRSSRAWMLYRHGEEPWTSERGISQFQILKSNLRHLSASGGLPDPYGLDFQESPL
jgi:hypothetical protein